MGEEQQNPPIEPPRQPLFTLDLGANGGVFAPTSVAEMQAWVQGETNFWTWTKQGLNVGTYKAVFDRAFLPLSRSAGLAREAGQFEAPGNESALRERVAKVQQGIQEAFRDRKLPHSSSPLAKRVAALKVEPRCAIAYLYPFLPTFPGENYPFDARDSESWHGFLMGLIDHYGIVTDAEPAIQAERSALEDLRKRAEFLLDEKKAAVEQLHRDFAEATTAISEARTSQQHDFEAILATSRSEHEEALRKHEAEMEALRTTFLEAMTLRGPVEYWQEKATKHERKASGLMRWMFGSMAALAIGLVWLTEHVFSTLSQGKPDTWKVAAPVLVGVVAIWAVRMVARMFLSHTHLATDAEERVTMVMTYLALLEGKKMPSDEDRKLVLAPLFRPATDGMVKDEGLPHPILELFTRMGQK